MQFSTCFSTSQLHNAANANQKEKYEADLKKEIKKLQVELEKNWWKLKYSECENDF